MDDALDRLEQRISGIAALDQPVRRRLYQLLAERDGWTSRDDAADALGIARSVAAFHLDKLAEAGIVDIRFERTSGRTGPGAGRPAKLYRTSEDEVSASVPDRDYELAGSLLASAVADSISSGRPVAECLSAAAHAAGRRVGEAVRAQGADADEVPAAETLARVLAGHGYEPRNGRPGEIALANCPFHRLAEHQRPLVCGMNLDFVGGIIEGLCPGAGLDARLAPEPGYCCVRVSRS